MNKSKKMKRKRLLNKTKKYFGGKNEEADATNSKGNVDTKNAFDIKKEGVFDIIGDKVSDFAVDTGDFLKDKTLRLFGLQPINENETDETGTNENKTNNAVSGLMSNAKTIGDDVVKAFVKGSTAIIGNINDVLESPEMENSVTQTAKETVESGKILLKKFNDKLNDPEFKELTKEALENVSEYSEIALEALNEPLDKAIDEFSEAGNKAAAGVVSGAIKVGTDAVGAIPGFGAIIEVGKMINDGTRAASTVVEAGSQAIETTSELIDQTTKGIKKGIEELEEKKKEAINITNRASNSINEFQKPLNFAKKINDKINKALPTTGGGNRKSKKRLLNRKLKSKRVRFAL
jgi:hypothetical protein